jgi:hypothetical protein
METAFIFLVMILILVILGFGGYFVYDYVQYKKNLESELEDTKKNIVSTKTEIANEKKTRLGNIKHVVDQVNETNLDIYNTFSSNAIETRGITDALTDTQNKMLTGLNSVIRFSNATVGAGASPTVNITELPGAPTVNMELLKQVNVLNGMTFKELSTTKNVKFCGLASDANTPPRCMEFPNTDGKTVFTNLVNDKPIVMDANTEFTSNVLFPSTNGGLLESTSSAQPLTLRSNKFVQVASPLAIGDSQQSMSDATLPTMAIYSSDSSKDAMKVSTTSKANALRVDSNGRLILANTNTFETDASNKLVVQTQGVRISAPTNKNIELEGNVNITGNITVNGVSLSELPPKA